MKKLLFVLAFAFIGGQAFSQMYIVAVDRVSANHPANCSNGADDAVMTTIDPQGNITYDCLSTGGQLYFNGDHIATLNQKFNSILNQGYKLVSTDTDNSITTDAGEIKGAWYFAIP